MTCCVFDATNPDEILTVLRRLHGTNLETPMEATPKSKNETAFWQFRSGSTPLQASATLGTETKPPWRIQQGPRKRTGLRKIRGLPTSAFSSKCPLKGSKSTRKGCRNMVGVRLLIAGAAQPVLGGPRPLPQAKKRESFFCRVR